MASVKLNEEQAEKIHKLEMSINHWSIEQAKLSVQVKRMVDAIDTLYETRKRELDSVLSQSEVDVKRVKVAYVDNENNLVYELED